MPRNKLIITLIGVLLIAIILVGVFWFLNIQENKQQNSEQVLQDLDNSQLPNNSLEPEIKQKESIKAPYVPKATEEQKMQAQLTKMASAFTERFGSYSNQSNYENLKDLLSFMAPQFKKWAQDKIDSYDYSNKPVIYYGITTKVLKTDLIDFSEDKGTAVFEIATQRNEVVGSSGNNKVIYQNMNLQMIEASGVWKVSQTTWE